MHTVFSAWGAAIILLPAIDFINGEEKGEGKEDSWVIGGGHARSNRLRQKFKERVVAAETGRGEITRAIEVKFWLYARFNLLQCFNSDVENALPLVIGLTLVRVY